MNTQKIQTSSNVKGFTLVELIVVITILVILGTIAFLNLGGMSASARDSQRTSDLNQINTQVMVIQTKNGLPYSSMVSSGVVNQLTTPSIAGTNSVVGTDYFAGDVNYTVLGVDSSKFKDPTKAVAYKMGSTTRVGTAYQLAASLEETNTALVMGTYNNRAATTVTVAVPLTGIVTITAADIGKFRINDTVGTTGGTPATNVVKSVSADGLTITLTTPLTVVGTALTLDAEATGLINSVTTPGTAVINKAANLAY